MELEITGAITFIESLGPASVPFQNYINAMNDIKILLRNNPQWRSENKGSIKQYLKYFPNDPYLREWVKLL